MSLNFSQKYAVECINGPCLILAGAGSGKTKVIINKIIYLIQNCEYEANNIIAVTFTNKAAHEIKSRLKKFLNPQQIRNIIISTFHSLGLEIIKNEINLLNFNANFSLLNDTDQITILKKILNNKEYNNDKKFLRQIISMISFWKNKFITPLKVSILAKSQLEKKFAVFYQKYEFYLRQFNILDFDDLICIPTILLKKNKIAYNRWQKKISYLLVDEYQDTNSSQYELLKMLTNIHSNFTLVGDDNQSIYSWRGAQPQNLLRLKTDFPNLKIIKMEQNYRSSGRILKVANSLISHNTNYFEKKLFSKLKYGKPIEVLIAQNEIDEAEKIIKKILYYKSIHKVEYEDCAILYRANYQSRILENILIKNSIPYYISGNVSFFSRPEIQDLLFYLRIVINPSDNNAFLKIINTPFRQIGTTTTKKLENFANKTHQSLFNASKDCLLESILSKKTIKKITQFINWIEEVIAESHIKPICILKKIIKDIKYKEWLLKRVKEPDNFKKSISNVYILLEWFKNMVHGNEFEQPMTIKEVVIKMTLNDSLDNNTSKNKIHLMTLHSSKGLEFSLVFIIGMIEGILPDSRNINKNVEEERRLTYVGITRAKKKLFFTFPRTYYKYGTIIDTQPSRFLFEMPTDDLLFEKNNSLYKNINVINKVKSRIVNFKQLLSQNKKKLKK